MIGQARDLSRLAIVTGGARGIGRAIVAHLVGLGYRVAILDLRLELACETAAELGPQARAYGCDIADNDQVQRTIGEIMRDLGSPWLLVNNAGWDNPKPFLTTTAEERRTLIGINLEGVLNMNHAVAPLMFANGGGRIVNIASDSGRLGLANVAVYSACKGAVMALTRSLAREFAPHKVLVNALSPGVTRTPMLAEVMGESAEATAWAEAIEKDIPLGRMALPEDMAPLVGFLASDGAAFITGQTISVSGGRYMG